MSKKSSQRLGHSTSRFNEHIEGDGPTVFAHACKLGLEGIVSKRKDSTYRSGRSPDWLKMKNSNVPAVKREEEEDWGKRPVAMKKHRINARSADLQKNCSNWSGVRQKTFGSCDLIMEGETGACKCLTLSTLSPPRRGAFLCRAARHATGRSYPCFHFARSIIRRTSALESTLSMILK
jgi:hypothetical protein